MTDTAAGDLYIAKVEHDCALPGYLGLEVKRARWRCPECRSLWQYTGPSCWTWKLLDGPCRRWRREAKRRTLAAFAEAQSA